MSVEESYGKVLNDLESRRHRCTEELKMLDAMISNLRQLSVQSQARVIASGAVSAPAPIPTRKYSGLSVRWAILCLLSDASRPLGRTDIAKTLAEGGITSSAQNFASNVSAVLSGMVNQRHELEQDGDGYRITQHGREVWEGIKRTPQWTARSVVPIAPTLSGTHG